SPIPCPYTTLFRSVLGSGHRRAGRRKFLPLERPSGARIITNPQPTARGRYRTVTIQAAIKSRPNGGQPSHDLVVEEAKPKLRKPPMYQVVMLNDDYTPMEFVVEDRKSVVEGKRGGSWSAA